MKRNNISRTMAASIAVTCLLSAASCSLPGGSGSDGSTVEKPKQTASDVIQHSYSAEPFGNTPDISYVDQIVRLGNTDKVLITGNSADYSETKFYITDITFENFKPLEFDTGAGKNSEVYYYGSAAPDGTIYAVVNINDYGDMELPDWNDPDFDYDEFDWDKFNDAMEHSTMLFTFDPEGKQLTKAVIDASSLGEEGGDSEETVIPYLGSVYPIDKDHALAYISGEHDTYVIVNSDGTFGKDVNFPSDLWLGTICSSPDGNLAFTSWSGETANIGTINKDTLQVKTDAITLKDLKNESVSTLISGDDTFAYYFTTYNGMYGVVEDGTCTELINWADSDINGDGVRGLIPIGNGEFAVYLYDYSDQSMNGFYRLTERDASELANKTLITVAVIYGDSSFKSEVNSFNRSNDKYRIKLVDYSEYYDWDEDSSKYLNTPGKQFKLDVISGKTPDMIFFSDPSVIKGLSSKGLFVDLNSYFGKNGSISKDDIMPSLLKACEENGKLYCIAPSFSMSTLAVKTKFCDKENWTFDDLVAAYNKLPEGSKFSRWQNTKMGVYQMLSNNIDFVDFSKGTCNYDSDAFIKLLEFANRFPDEEEEVNWDTMTEEQMNKYYEDQETCLRKDKALVDNVDFYDFRSYNNERVAVFGDDITFVGYPSDNGCGLRLSTDSFFAILSDSPNKDECWSFINRFFTEDYQEKNTWSIPALKSQFEKKLDEAMQDPYWTDNNGEKHYEENKYYIGSEAIDVPNLTQEERDYLRDYIYNANISGISVWDSDVNNIVNEEVEAYFAGEKSAKQTAEIIQNRVSILISEQS